MESTLACIGYLARLAHEHGDTDDAAEAYMLVRDFPVADRHPSVSVGRLIGLAMTRVSPVPETWQPVKGWGASIGAYSFALLGDRFAIGQTEYIRSIDELLDLLRQVTP